MTEPPFVLTATYRVVTPMFLSGADQNQAELRVPSFKGALRFWWRALAATEYQDVARLREAEEALFGSTRTGASRVRMRILSQDAITFVAKGKVLREGNKVVGEGARYLGYGVMEAFASKKKGTQAGELTRPCLSAPFSFTVSLHCRLRDDESAALLLRALQAIGLFGGLGSKSRKGYGSLVLDELKVDDRAHWNPPSDIDELAVRIDQVIGARRPANEPDFSSFSQTSRVLTLQGGDNTMQLLDRIGREMVRYRSWGHNGKVLGEESERNFKFDHDLMKRDPRERREHPQRVAFGLPHNYGKYDRDQIPSKHKSSSEPGRRASPLLLHLHECGGKPVAVLTFLPAQFLPTDNAGRQSLDIGGQSVSVTPSPEIWQPVERFLDRLVSGDGRKESFAAAREVLG